MKHGRASEESMNKSKRSLVLGLNARLGNKSSSVIDSHCKLHTKQTPKQSTYPVRGLTYSPRPAVIVRFEQKRQKGERDLGAGSI